MLGTIGFITAAVTYLIYGYSSYNLAKKNPGFDREIYFTSYIFTAIACTVWALSINRVFFDLEVGVLIGDLFLLLASVLLLTTFIKQSLELPVLVLGSIASITLVLFRALSSDISPVVRDSVLVFNTPRVFGVLLAAVMLFVWVKANMNFYSKVVHPKLPNLLRPQYYAANLLGFISVTSFLMARKNITIIFAFGLLVSSFLFLVILNYYVQSIPRKAAKHAR